MTLYRFWIFGTGLFSVYVPVESILEETGMIYIRKKNPKFLDFFVEESEILGVKGVTCFFHIVACEKCFRGTKP